MTRMTELAATFPLTADHADAAAALMAHAYTDSRIGATPWSAGSIISSLASAHGFGLGINTGGQPDPDAALAGFLLARQLGSEAELLAIAVNQQERRHGYGRILLNTMIGRLKQEQTASVFLEVAVENHPAIQFYQIHGFEISGRRPRYYGSQDALIMQLSI